MNMEWKDGADGVWRIMGGKLEEAVEMTTVELKRRFPLLLSAAEERFAVYSAVVFLLGYMNCTRLPQVLEDAIKATWAEPRESSRDTKTIEQQNVNVVTSPEL
ncbi:hypothetical protein R1sor_019228 [Riccia sorocarpa]|uniref:Uncharacterized protein n=1 Tax=Riccia sorocarpa TaxID=122646 RepID=A0ABD3ID12_9MARC